ncbi:MAG: rRNA maturation RNase YbeY [Syntrophales bacterium]|nr:rRNA maturation RNase YbeY [Syntrophales bacterium]
MELKPIKTIANRIMRELKLKDYEVSLLLTDDEGITQLNHLYLKRNRPTNVISFPMNEGTWLGDIAISVETAAREAEEGDMTLRDEIVYLFIHGLLHLIGYDHESGDESAAALMRDRERSLFSAVMGYEID